MKTIKSIDAKSFAVGVLALALFLACTDSNKTPIVNTANAADKTVTENTSQIGRYQLQADSNSAWMLDTLSGDTFLLNPKTKLWRKICELKLGGEITIINEQKDKK